MAEPGSATQNERTYFLKGPFPASFLYFRLFNSFNSMVNIIFGLWLDSNRRPLVSEATSLPTEPQPLTNDI